MAMLIRSLRLMRSARGPRPHVCTGNLRHDVPPWQYPPPVLSLSQDSSGEWSPVSLTASRRAGAGLRAR
jgi:hypothetical protein